eukprot:CCRYP_013028-RA/>CCRYP_013028-RA protein AED:0.42 eAED:0.42 QI:0/-1/0/1/-1/1/1/0/273
MHLHFSRKSSVLILVKLSLTWFPRALVHSTPPLCFVSTTATTGGSATLKRSISTSHTALAFIENTMPKRNHVSRNNGVAETDNETNNVEVSKQYFLLKSEPDDYSISDLQRDGTEEWNGIRNYQARNFLRTMKVGDRAFFYHSKASTPDLTGIVGTCKIARTAQPDVSALDPNSEYYDAKCTKENCRWDSVLVEYEQSFPVVLSLKEIKEIARQEPTGIIAGLALLKQSRLSVVSLNQDEWNAIMLLIDAKISMFDENTAPTNYTHGNKKPRK